MNNVGRKSKYETHVKSRFDEIEEWLGLGATEKEIWTNLGIHKSTFYDYKAKNKEFSDIISKGKMNRINIIKKEPKTRKYLSKAKIWTVYKHTSPVNKVYIGITSQNPEDRWLNGNNYKGNKHFNSAIKKYGWSNFKHEILFENLTKQEAKDKEIELITLYDSTNPDKGYNLSSGGEAYKLSRDEIIERALLREAKKSNGGKSSTLEEILDDLDKVTEMSENGYNKTEIARHYGITRQTLYAYELSAPEITAAIKRGRRVVVNDIKAAMLKRAKGFQYEEKKVIIQKIKFDDENLGEIPAKVIREEITTKTALPDTAAGLVLLQHWDLDEKGKPKWSRDPASREIKQRELELKEKQAENDAW